MTKSSVLPIGLRLLLTILAFASVSPVAMAQNNEGAAETIIYRDASGTATEVELPKTDPAILQKFLPSQMAQNLGQEILRVNAASKAAWSHSTQSLAGESGIFAISMGAVVAGEVFLDSAQNPLALQQFIDNQTSPLGVTSFFAFMYSQGVTSNVLSMYLQHPALRSLIPYLGMSVGAFVQSNLSQFASDPDVQSCARSWLPKTSSLYQATQGPVSPCDQAYDKFVNRRKIWEAVPGITSMLISSAITSGGQALTRQILLHVTGFDLMILLVPGGVEFRGLRLLLKGMQISSFVAIDSWLNSKVTYVWKNGYNGNEFNNIESSLAQEIALQNTLRWSADNRNLIEQLKLYHTRAVEWRLFNLSDVYEAHQAWAENLHHLSGMYNASYNFYTAFLNEVRSAQKNPMAPLNRTSPYNGVTAKGLKAEDADLYFTDPLFVQTMQMAHVRDVAASIGQKILLGTYREQGITEPTIAVLQKLRDRLSNSDPQAVGATLLELQRAVYKDSGTSLSDGELTVELQKIYTQLGRPAPAMKKGYGFVRTFENAPSTGSSLKDIPFYRRVGDLKTETITDYLLATMVCGPDVQKQERAIFNVNGFPGVFTPPQIRQDGIALENICQTAGVMGGFSPDRHQIPATDSSDVIDFLKKYTRADVLGAQEDSLFQKWWETNTQPQMQKTIGIYAESYKKIIAKLIAGVFREDLSILNAGDMPNGAAKSLLREAQMNEKILAQMLSALSSTLRPPIQVEFESKLNELIGLLKRIQVSKDEKGNVVLKSDLKNKEIADKKTEIQKILERWTNGLGAGDGKETPWVRLDSVQKELASTCLNNLSAIAMEAGQYGSIANAVSWDAVVGTEESSDQEKSFLSMIQQKLGAMKKSLLPVGTTNNKKD